MGILIATCSHNTKDHNNKTYRIKGQSLEFYEMAIKFETNHMINKEKKWGKEKRNKFFEVKIKNQMVDRGENEKNP